MKHIEKPFIERLKSSVKELKKNEDMLWTKASSPNLLMKNLSKNIDSIICELWTTFKLSKNCCLLAIGGFGRGELAPHSDIDLQILTSVKELDKNLSKSISSFISAMWDIGLEAGHSVRSVDETISLSKIDTSVATSMLELRFLAGKKALFNSLKEKRTSEIDSVNFARHKLLELRQRHERYQNTPYSLEPNVKESPGGLRDLHTVNWICLEFGYGKNWRHLAFNQLITLEEARQLYRQQKILQTIRGHLHLSSKRREDRLVFDLQSDVAKRMGIVDLKGRRASEILMQKYFRAAKLILQISEIILTNLEPKFFPNLNDSNVIAKKKIKSYIEFTNEKNLKVKKHYINFIESMGFLRLENEREIHIHPSIILKLFHVLQTNSQIRKLDPQTTRLIWNNRNLINSDFRKSLYNKELFLQIFKEPKAVTRTLRLMNDLGVLGRILPVFRNIVGQMQHDLFHVYTVDQHTLHVIRNIERYTQQEHAHEFPLCSELMSKFNGHWKLYLAAFFHDIGKGRGGDHSVLGAEDAKNFSKNFNLNVKDSELIEFLVKEHLTMSQLTQKEDIDDPVTIKKFYLKVQTEERLVALYLLTVADIRGTSPKVWNNWKGKLLERLFYSTLNKINTNQDGKKVNLEQNKASLLSERKFQKIFSIMQVSYFLKHDSSEILWHAQVLINKINSKIPIVKAKVENDVNGIKIIIYEKASKGLFSKIVEYFDSVSFSVLDAKINTTKHGYALNSFVLNQKSLDQLSQFSISTLENGLLNHLENQNKINLKSSGRKSRRSKYFPITPTVVLSADEKNEFHILSLTAGDKPGLLFGIAKVLQQHDISVQTARISTLGERVEDVFVVQGKSLANRKDSIQLESDLITTLEA